MRLVEEESVGNKGGITLLFPDGVTKSVEYEQIFGDLRPGGAKSVTSPRGAWDHVSWLRRCVAVRANALADMPFSLGPRGVDTGDGVWRSELELEPPEHMAAWADLPRLLWLIESSWALNGQAYMVRRRNGALQWVNPDTVEVGVAPNGRLSFKRSIDSQQRMYTERTMLGLFAPDPFIEAGPSGSSDAFSALVHARSNRRLAEFLDGYIERGLIKAHIIKVPKTTKKSERDKVNAWWKNLFGKGPDSAGAQVVVQADGIEPVPVGEGLSDLGASDVTRDEREAIAAAIGVPYSLVGTGVANYAVKEGDKLDLYDHLVKTDAKLIEVALNTHFSGLGLQFRFHPKRLEVFQKRELQKAEKINSVCGAPVLSRNEGRELLGYAPVDDPTFDIPLDVVADEFGNIEDLSDESSNNQTREVVERDDAQRV